LRIQDRFGNEEIIIVYVCSTQPIVLGSFLTDKQGNVDLELTMPDTVEPGPHVLVVSGVDKLGRPVVLTASIFVERAQAPADRSRRPLPFTGVNVWRLLVLGATLVIVGAGLLLGASRSGRRRHQTLRPSD
jgi:hypothetical protein